MWRLFWCNIGFHNWTQWSNPINKQGYAVQYRRCERCNRQMNYMFRDFQPLG